MLHNIRRTMGLLTMYNCYASLEAKGKQYQIDLELTDYRTQKYTVIHYVG
jgi:hypothetical protein